MRIYYITINFDCQDLKTISVTAEQLEIFEEFFALFGDAMEAEGITYNIIDPNDIKPLIE